MSTELAEQKESKSLDGTKALTEKQSLFLDSLFGESKGDPRQAMRQAGYSDHTKIGEVMGPLKERIVEGMNDHLAFMGPRALLALVDILDNPKDLSNKYKLAAAKEILDRLGVSKEAAAHSTPTVKVKNVILLPEKKEPVIVEDVEYSVEKDN